MSAMPVDGGPYLAAAVFCEKILRETDGVISLVRVVDRWTIPGTTEQMPVTVLQTNIVLMIKSGMFRGSAEIVVTPTAPSGKLMAPIILSANFEGDDDRGVAIAGPIAFPVNEAGVYWLDLSVHGQSLTKMPLRVIYLRTVGPVPIPHAPNP